MSRAHGFQFVTASTPSEVKVAQIPQLLLVVGAFPLLVLEIPARDPPEGYTAGEELGLFGIVNVLVAREYEKIIIHNISG